MTAPLDPDRLAAVLRDATDVGLLRPLHVVVHAARAELGQALATALGHGPVRVTVLGAPLPALTDLGDLRSVVLEHGADAGVAVDGDRLRVLDEHGEPVPASTVLTVVGLRVVAVERAAGRVPVVVHDDLTSRAVPDLLDAAGATTQRVRSSELVERVATQDAVLGGRADGLLMLRDAPTGSAGLLGALHVVAELGAQPHPLSVLAELYQPYAGAGPIEVAVADADEALARVVDAYVTTSGAGPVEADERDGLLVSHWGTPPPWWFALRGRGPVVELTVEAADEDVLDKVRDDVLSLLRTAEDR